jgi:hypothetical protein
MKADSPSVGRLTRFLAADLAPAAFDRSGGGAGREIFIPGNKESPGSWPPARRRERY